MSGADTVFFVLAVLYSVPSPSVEYPRWYYLYLCSISMSILSLVVSSVKYISLYNT